MIIIKLTHIKSSPKKDLTFLKFYDIIDIYKYEKESPSMIKDTKIFSVIIPMYNGAGTIENALASLMPSR